MRGFTLIELVVTVLIVGMLAASAVPLVGLAVQRQKESELRSALRDIRKAIDGYHAAVVAGRIAKDVTASGYPKRLEDLADGVTDISQPNRRVIRFLRRLPRDPFYPDGHAPAAETWGKRCYDSTTEAPKEGEDVYDVYTLSPATGLNGVAYRDW